ncbi:NUDIX hydrolase [bacterium]|nr:NUDIX hydrolase [bacterium]
MEKGIIVHTIITKHGELLIIKRSKNNFFLSEEWDTPGGTLKDGENPIDGAIREVKEETGLNITNLVLFSFNSIVDKNKDKQFITLIFLAECIGNSKKIILNKKEHDDFRWINLNQTKNFKTVFWLSECLNTIREKKHPMIKIIGKKH